MAATNEHEHEQRDVEEAGANEVAITAGEEDEDAVLDLKSKERGAGTVKLLKHKNTGKIRLVMKQSKTLKICANHFGKSPFTVKQGMSVKKHVGNEKSRVWHARDCNQVLLSLSDCKAFMQKLNEVAESEVEKEESKDAFRTI
ncbi:Ran binding domain-containing protein [Hirschfeldia incana]|nr:Ran binding domain-containing protein [Hirschfeldia incana]